MDNDNAARDALVESLARSDGFPIPSAERFADRVLERLRARDWDVRPTITIGWQPAVNPEGKIPWIWLDSGAVAWSRSPNVPPTDGGRWALLYVQTKNGEIIP